MNETPRFKWVRKGGACAAFICKWFSLGVVRYSSKSISMSIGFGRDP